MNSRAKELSDRIEAAPPEQFVALREEVGQFLAQLEKEAANYSTILDDVLPKQFDRPLYELEARHRAAQWRALSVVERIGFTSDDSIRLDKVREAYDKSTPAQLVTITHEGTRYVPTPKHEAPRFHAKAESRTDFEVDWNGPHQLVQIELRKKSRPLPVGSTALLWEVDGGNAVLVTPSGGRYITTNIQGVATMGATQVQHAFEDEHAYLSMKDIEVLEGAGQLSPGTHAKLDGLIGRADRCAGAIWKVGSRKLEALEVADIHPTTRENRMRTLRGDLRAEVERKCNHLLPKIESAFARTLDEWQSKRAAVLAANELALSK